jgi:RNA polymerase sigma-70 factor (ECF subfamily)
VDAAGDAALVAAARRDPAAFERLYDRFADPVLNFCYYRLGAWEEAEDAAQQVFANAYAGLDRFRDRDGSFRSWLFTIAHHEVANRRRGQARHPSVPLAAASGLYDAGPTPEELAVAAEEQGRVRALLAELSDDQRRVLELRFAGLTDVEIGGVLGRTPGAVRAVQARGVGRLRQLLATRPARQGGGHA